MNIKADNSKRIIDYLLILRGIAVMAIILRHAHLRIPEKLLGFDINWLIDPFGYTAVLIFFTLSGYLITKSYVTDRYNILSIKGLSDYYRNRFFRIIPLYYFSILICILIYYERTFNDPKSVLKMSRFMNS